MAIYYVDSTATGGADTGGSWANAFLTFAQGVTAANTAGDLIYVSHAHSESLSADTTYTFTADVRVLCVNSGTGALATTGLIGAQATNYAITVAGAFEVYFYGITFQNGTNNTSSKTIGFNADGAHYEFENCLFDVNGNTNSRVQFGNTSATNNFYSKLKGCTANFGNAAHAFSVYAAFVDFENCALAGTSTTLLFVNQQAFVKMIGCDLSVCTGTITGSNGGNSISEFNLIACKLGSGVVLLGAPTAVYNKGQTTVTAYDCSAGDSHYGFYHGDSFGETTVVSTPYLSASSGGTNVSYKVVTKPSNCSFYTPYVGPWIAKYHTGTTAITPSFEILRDGSATAYQDDEVWGEWSYKGTSGSTQASFVNDRMTPLGTPANQATGDLGAGDWTGENATAWFGKLAPASAITPAEVGFIYGRVVVGEPNTTVYFDPQIRLA